MVHPSLIEARLGELGFKTSRWFHAEIRELEHILMDDEKIISLVCGRYYGSFALLVATDQRLLLIDKRVFFMTIEDTRYDMISEIDYNSQAYNATVTVYTMNKTHKFTSIKFKRELRQLTNYVQRRVWEFRQQQSFDTPNISQSGSTRFIPTDSALPPSPYHATAIVQPKSEPIATDDYYVVQQPGGRAWRGQLGHVAHMVGSAATRSAHHHTTYRPMHPYSQGSLMTRKPLSTPGDY